MKELGDVAHLQSMHQVVTVHFDCANADLKLSGDFSVGKAFGDHFQNLVLTGGQAARWAASQSLSGCSQSCKAVVSRHGALLSFSRS